MQDFFHPQYHRKPKNFEVYRPKNIPVIVFHWAQIRGGDYPAPSFFKLWASNNLPNPAATRPTNKDLKISSHPNSIQDPIWVMREYQNCFPCFLLKIRVSPNVSTGFRGVRQTSGPRCSKSWRPKAEDSSCPRPLRLGSWGVPSVPKTTETIW